MMLSIACVDGRGGWALLSSTMPPVQGALTPWNFDIIMLVRWHVLTICPD